jgi:hypothetical protein
MPGFVTVAPDAGGMKRTYRSNTTIRLPVVTANNDVVLGGRLVDAANAERRLPALITKRLDRVVESHGDLAEALRQRVASAAAVEQDRKEVHNANMAAWSALRARIEAHQRLPGDGSSDVVDRIAGILFVGGLDFLRLSYTEGWAEADSRLGLLKEEELEDTVREIAGAKFYDAVLEAHEQGRRVIRAADPRRTDPELKRRHLAYRKVVRAYVGSLTTHADEDADAAALVDRLLAPLVAWRTSRNRTDGDEAVAVAPAPAAPAPEPR